MRRWRREQIESIFQHPLFTLERHHLAAGRRRREALVLEAPDWVNVIPLLADGRVLLVRQWRYGIAAPTLEIPGGMVEEGDARAAAARELEEETGYRAGRLDELGWIWTTPGFTDERIWLFLARDLAPGRQSPEPDEVFELVTLPLADAVAAVVDGGIRDSKSVSALLLAERFLS